MRREIGADLNLHVDLNMLMYGLLRVLVTKHDMWSLA